MGRGSSGRRRDRSDWSSPVPGTARRGWSTDASDDDMRVDSALAMGLRGAPKGLIAAVAVSAALCAPSLATAAPYPAQYDFSQGLLAQAAPPDSPPPGPNYWSCQPSAAPPRPVRLRPGPST